MSKALVLKQLKFSYTPNAAPVINIQHYQLEALDTVFLYGPSGCGKTTLLNLICGVLLPDQGDIDIFGHHLTAMSHQQRDQFRAANIGLVFQQFNLIPYLSVYDNLKLTRHFLNTAKKFTAASLQESVVTEDIELLLRRLNLSNTLLSKKAMELSMGQQQRVAIARALLNRPRLLIADEPTSALDSDSVKHFIELLLQCAQEYRSSVMFVSHDQNLAQYFNHAVNLTDINNVE